MRITCAYSGLQIQVQYFPASLDARECTHPIFCIPQKKLLQYVRKWSNAELTEVDSYLLYLALLNSTECVEWRVPAIRTRETSAIVASNMEALARVVSYAGIIRHPSFVLPRAAVTKETANLQNSAMWIRDWLECYADFNDGYIREKEREKLKRREQLLQTFIKSANKPIQHYAKILADWAAEAGEFPQFNITVDGKSVSLSEYWKSIIIKCCKEEYIFSIPSTDLEELISHCEDNILHGSIYAHTLMELLRAGKKRQVNYLGLGDADLSSTSYQIISAETTAEDANKMAMILAAPDSPPVETAYPSKIAFLRAKLSYSMKQDWLAQQETVKAIQANVTTIVLDDGKEI